MIPPKHNAEFGWRMEALPEVYTRPYDPRRPLVCLDEMPEQLLADARPPLPMQPGRPALYDYEYERRGTANLFLACEPLASRRRVEVTDRRTAVDWAQQIKGLVEVRYPEAERIVLVVDNLNTHPPAALYEACPPAEAKRLADKLELHYTPKHGSWLNIAEIELSVLSRLAAFRPCFTAPGYRNFCLLVGGRLHCNGRRTVTAVALAAGAVGIRHISACQRFFGRATWSLDAVGRAVFALAVRWLPADQPLVVLVDDTLARKIGKGIGLATMHHDPLLSSARKPFCSFGHVRVVLAL